MTDETPRDETHDSIDRVTGTLTEEAVARRAEITARVNEANGAKPRSWLETLAEWLEMGEHPQPAPPDAEPVADPTIQAVADPTEGNPPDPEPVE